jgi:hypothetical protein
VLFFATFLTLLFAVDLRATDFLALFFADDFLAVFLTATCTPWVAVRTYFTHSDVRSLPQ